MRIGILVVMPRATHCFTPPKITQKEAKASAADDVLIAESFEGFAEPVRAPRRKNPAEDTPRYGTSPAVQEVIGRAMTTEGRKKRGKAWKVPKDAFTLYDGHEGLLVRTALIRAPSFDAGEPLPRASSPADIERLLAHLQYADQEHLVVLAMNNTNRVQAIYEVGIGSAKAVTVGTRDIVKILLLSGSIAAIIAHNHPSGDPMPSAEDIAMTKTVKEAFACLGYALLDHVIIGRGQSSSFYSMGLL